MGSTLVSLDADRVRLRLDLEDLYTEYAECLDDERLEEWPELFAESCVYKVISRENFDRGLPLGVMHCVGKGMLKDRVTAIRKTSMFAPRALRHLVSGVRIKEQAEGELRVQANFAVLQTLVDCETTVFSAGRYLDHLVAVDGRWLFAEKLCVYDSVLISNSLI
jgi:anthranilate 1,2-dioxygenase small subunit